MVMNINGSNKSSSINSNTSVKAERATERSSNGNNLKSRKITKKQLLHLSLKPLVPSSEDLSIKNNFK